MHVAGLWRYPVKSFQGEARDHLEIVSDGVEGDRDFGVLDLESATVLSGKRYGQLLTAFARLDDDGLVVELPSGRTHRPGPGLDAGLSQWLGRASRLVAAEQHGQATFTAPTDFEHEEDSALREWQSPVGRFVDARPVHLLTTASLRACAAERSDLDWLPRRFRPNVLIEADGDGPIEETWIGRRLAVGDAVLEVLKSCSRCVVTTRPQPGGVTRQLDVLRHLASTRDANFGVLASVVRVGAVKLGGPVELAD